VTTVEVLAETLLTKIALNNIQALRGVLATIIVWLGALLAGLLLPVIFVKRTVQDDRRPTIRSAP
jgi:hypothetical protein